MRNYFCKFTFLTLLTFILASFSFAQDGKFPTPREENLLNGLKVLIWSQPKSGRVSVSLRIHSGSAFDPQDKEGTTALLADILFPDAGIKNFFEDDLEGKLEVIHTYDYIQINATAKSDDFLAVFETLAPAISDPQINKETFEKVKAKRLEKLEELEKDADYIADQAVAERLFGDFPYGRSIEGTTESINNLDYVDVIFAKQRFLTSDNATLTITGDVKSDYAYKVARRLFGGWQKSLKKTPANFRLPEEPELTPLTINIDEPNIIVDRYSIDSFSRKDKNYYATVILTEILNERFNKISKQDGLKESTVKYHPNYLRGNIVFSKSFQIDQLPVSEEVKPMIRKTASNENVSDHKLITSLFTTKITQSEFNTAKTKVATDLNKLSADEFWLEIDTYKFNSPSGEFKKLNNTTLIEVQKVAAELGKNKIVNITVESVASKKPKVKVVPTPVEKPLDEDISNDDDPNDPQK